MREVMSKIILKRNENDKAKTSETKGGREGTTINQRERDWSLRSGTQSKAKQRILVIIGEWSGALPTSVQLTFTELFHSNSTAHLNVTAKTHNVF